MRFLRMIIECHTPLHCGGGESPGLDDPVITDAFGLWRVPGSSLAGGLRALLAESVSEEAANALFGEGDRDQPRPSLVWAQDGLVLDFDDKPCLAKKLAGEEIRLPMREFTRDHVRLDEKTGAAADGGKFDCGIVPAGARFLLNIRCDGWSRQLTQQEKSWFDQLCARLAAGESPLGGKTGIGYGAFRALATRYIDLDLNKPEDMETWLNLDALAHIPPKAGKDIPLPKPQARAEAEGLCGSLELPLVCDGPLLIGGGLQPERYDLAESSGADMTFAFTPWLDYKNGRLDWRFALPGSSLRGALRNAVYKISQDMNLDADGIINAIFGFVDQNSGKAKRGAISVGDCALAKAGPGKFVQHVAIDRFTGGTINGALFSEEPFWQPGQKATLRFAFSGIGKTAALPLLHALLDLASGAISVGAGGCRGNGKLRLPDWPEKPKKAFSALRGDLGWNGKPLIAGFGTWENLLALAEELDKGDAA